MPDTKIQVYPPDNPKLALHDIISNQVDLGGIKLSSALNAKKPPQNGGPLRQVRTDGRR